MFKIPTLTTTLTTIAIFTALPSQNIVATQSNPKQSESSSVTITPVGQATVLHPFDNPTHFKDSSALPNTALEESCNANLAGTPTWAIGGWIIGNETFTSYQDPTITCPINYPFLVETTHVFLNFSARSSVDYPVSITLSTQIVSVDSSSTQSCPKPGSVIYASSPQTFSIPTSGFFDIPIPLDAPFEVNGPYFISLIFEDTVTSSMGVELVTDDIETLCVTYNKWDSTIGFIDLGDDTLIHHFAYTPLNSCFNAAPNTAGCFDFDGRMILYSTGSSIVCCNLAGDANQDGEFNLADVTFSIARIFSRGPAATCQDEIDSNGDNAFNISDVTRSIASLFANGPPPVCGTTGR